jgi:NitT/TauT family transport system permease protein
MAADKSKTKIKHYGYKLFSLGFWLIFWEAMSRWVGHEILLASPIAVAATLIKLIQSLDFWQTILFSSLRIIMGFLLALMIGTLLAIVSHNSRLMKELITPVMKMIQAMPVASFIILALIWIRAKNLSVLASFLMVMPLIYSNVAQGIKETDEKQLQMAKVFQLNLIKKVTAIYIPSVMPYLISAVTVGLGLCWKAGIAAEVIGIPTGSIGERLYEAKLYLMTKELFAWTIVIIIISIVFEKTVMLCLRLLHKEPAVQEQTAEEE